MEGQQCVYGHSVNHIAIYSKRMVQVFARTLHVNVSKLDMLAGLNKNYNFSIQFVYPSRIASEINPIIRLDYICIYIRCAIHYNHTVAFCRRPIIHREFKLILMVEPAYSHKLVAI